MKALRFIAGFLLILFSAGLLAQPQYYNYNTNGTNNSFPFNQAAGKMVQYLYLANDFNTPTPAPAGSITKWYFRVGDTYPLNATYTNFYIRMGQTNITSFSGTFYTGTMDTVFVRASGFNLTGAGGAWVMITLDNPFAYDPTQSLVIEIGQCSSTQGTGFSVCNTTVAGNRRTYSVGGCPYTFSGQGTQIINSGVDIAPPLTPNAIYYKFEDNPSPLSTPNCAQNFVGTNPATFSALTLTPGGQFDTCITGTGAASGGVTSGWNCNLGTSSWTISMWVTIPSTSSGTAYYLFGDAGSGSFRCFHNGVAGMDNLVLRGGFTDVNVTGIGPAPTVVTFVYDSAAAQVRAYKNGVLANTVNQTLNITTGTGFKVGGYATSPTFVGKMDEFRLYRRALTPSEITSMFSQNTACATVVGIGNNNNQTPVKFSLEQNYPNPFNPSTNISFALPTATMVELKVYDILGREVAVLVNNVTPAGSHTVEFDASSLSSGVYFYTLKAGQFTETKKMALVK